MKTAFFIASFLLLLAGSAHACAVPFVKFSSFSSDIFLKDTIPAEKRFSLNDAEKILGEKAVAGENRTEKNAVVQSSTMNYSAVTIDEKTGKTGNVGVMFEYYYNAEDANAKYDEMLASNRNSPGVKILNNIGDEAWSHSDGSNFYLIIIRKDNRMFRMKVNKLTSKTSIGEFNRYAGKVAQTL